MDPDTKLAAERIYLIWLLIVRGPDADRRANLLMHLAVEGSLLDAYSHAGLSSAPLRGSIAAEGLPRIAKNLNRKALAFLRLASMRLMLRKFCNPT